MITEKLLDLLFGAADIMLNLLPDISFSLPIGVWGGTASFLNMIGYLLPIGTINAIVGTIIDIAVFRIAIAGIRAIWKFIPFVGG